MLENIKGALFDLDGVIVDTAKYHYKAWKMIADSLGIDFNEIDNERLKGVSRDESLEIILRLGSLERNADEKKELAAKKNELYKEYIKNIDQSELLQGAKEYIMKLKLQGVKIALGSASKNASFILSRLGIIELFDAVIDGNKVSKAKPDPQVFLLGAEELNLKSEDCVVFEDAEAGVQAGKNAGMKVVGIGKKEILKDADMVVSGLYILL